jgi:hypothetical protein
MYPDKKSTIRIEGPLELSQEYPFPRKKTLHIPDFKGKIFYGEDKYQEMLRRIYHFKQNWKYEGEKKKRVKLYEERIKALEKRPGFTLTSRLAA